MSRGRPNATCCCPLPDMTTTPGIYLLILHLPETGIATTRSGQHFHLEPGWYLYAGSAMNGLAARLRRYFRPVKTVHWHIDALRQHARIVGVGPFISGEPTLEHALADLVSAHPEATPIPGFGASDCRCSTHLFRFPELPETPFLKHLLAVQMEWTVARLARQYDGIRTPVEQFRAPWEILVSCVISLRTRDEVTGPAAARLFAAAPSVHDLAEMDPERIGELIYPAGFYKTKARNLKTIATIIRDQYNGRVPDRKADLMALPGVGIKTANLVLADGFGQNEICVDTHVHRISNRLGWIQTRTPEESESVLKHLLPASIIRDTNGLMVKHGQNICKPMKPLCNRCPVRNLCMTGLQT